MKKFFTELSHNIFGWRILLSICILSLIFYQYHISNNLIIENILYLIMTVIAISYFWSSYNNKLDRRNDNNKVTLTIRSIVHRFFLVVILKWVTILFSSLGIVSDENLIDLFSLILLYSLISLIFSVFAIMIGIKLRTFLVLMLVLLPILLLLGAFDIKWWALVTGFITLWNFINSDDFLTYLRGGKKLENVPKELKYKWSINKFVIYILTFLFYFSLIISSFFEKKNPCSFEDYLSNGRTRVYSMSFIIVSMIILFGILFGYYYLLNQKTEEGRVAKFLLNIGKKIGLDKFNSTIKLYVKAKKGELK